MPGPPDGALVADPTTRRANHLRREDGLKAALLTLNTAGWPGDGGVL